MRTWLYFRNMTIHSLGTLPCGVVSSAGWVLAAVPDAQDKGPPCDWQSPLCQRHVTDEKHLYTPHATTWSSSCVTLYGRSRTVLFYDCEPGPPPASHSSNKRQFCSYAFTSTTRNIPPHPYHRSARILGSNNVHSGYPRLLNVSCV